MAWDMGIFDQALWNTLKGDILFSSIRGNINLLGDHFEPILLLILPLYALWPHVVTLIIIQSVALASCVFMIYLIAREKIASRALIFALLISFLLSKTVRGVGLSDFHPECFMPILSFVAFYALLKNKFPWLILSIFLLLLCKETATLIVIGLGLYSFFSLKKVKIGIYLLSIGIFSWVAETKFIIPVFNTFSSYLFNVRMPFGETYKENMQFVFSHPFAFLNFIFMPKKLFYLFKLLGSASFLPLFAPSTYLLIMVPLLTVMLASEKLWGYYLLSSHYVGHIIAPLYIAAIYGTGRILKFLQQKAVAKNTNITGFAAVVIILSLLSYGKTDAYKFRRYVEGISKYHSFERLSALSMIPSTASVCASSNLIPHLSHRKYIYDWDPESDLSLMTDYLVIDLNFLDYLKDNPRDKINDFLREAQRQGYKAVLLRPDLSLFIYFKPNNDNSPLAQFRGNIGI
jgi:uncharacterized membrane protein